MTTRGILKRDLSIGQFRNPAMKSPQSQPTELASEAQLTGDKRERGITGRVVALGLGLAIFFGYFSPIIDHKLSNTFMGATHLPPGAIAVILLLLVVINPLLKLLSARWAFHRNETLTVYITCLFSVLTPGHGAENFFIANILGPFYLASRENKWLEQLVPYLPSWLSPALSNGSYDAVGKTAVENWYLGNGGNVPWSIWLAPLLAWGSLILASYLMLACLSVMLRAQWAEREALNFPLLRLPLEMTEDGGQTKETPFLRNPIMWIGFGIAAFVQLLNGLNGYFPDVPVLPLGLNSAPFLTDAPWNQIGAVELRVWPMAVGIAFLLTAETSFSLWFFYWFFKFQLVAAYFLGFTPSALPAPIGRLGPDTKLFLGYQQVGAFLLYVGLLMWAGREHFAHIARRGLGRAKAKPEEKREAMSYPFAFWGFMLAFLFLVGWSAAAGVRADVALVLWCSYLVIAIGLTRVVAEAGLLFVQQGWTPLGAIAQVTGSGPGTWLAPSTLAPATFIQGAMMSDLRAFLMPSFVQSFKLAYDRGIPGRPLMALIAAVTVIAFSMSVWTHIHMGYQGGALQWGHGWWVNFGASAPGRNVTDLAGGARDESALNWVWMALGGTFTYGLVLARSRFPWFPLHPLGYLMGITSPVNRFWLSIFIGWGCKVLIMRFGGSDTYRKVTPGFLGLVLGDVTMMVFWLLIDGWQGRTNHGLMPA